MKKIFAIALALVMVLSMASAFASQCTAGFDWTSTSVSNCGKAKVEVVPYVKVNNGCGGFNWKVSECAGAVTGENVYFALKLTVDANPDKEWLDKAEIVLKTSGLDYATSTTMSETGIANDNTSEAVYYFDRTFGWRKVGTDAGQISVADDVENTSATTNPYIYGVKVNDSSKAKVCLTLKSTGNDFT